MKISFTKRAENNFREIKQYIFSEWGELVANAFEQKFIDLLDLLERFPEMGFAEVPEKQIRGFLLSKQTRVYYRIKGDKIIILRLFDVRQNPTKKPR